MGTVRNALSWIIDDWEAGDPDPELESCGQGSEMGNADPLYKLQRRLLVSSTVSAGNTSTSTGTRKLNGKWSRELS